jgi:formimidoylglutamate deiminase
VTAAATETALFCPSVLLAGECGWVSDVLLRFEGAGRIAGIEHGASPADASSVAAGPVVPGMPNLHSHAFQRAMAGLAERAAGEGGGDAQDGFWTWRRTMYAFLARLSPEAIEAIAAQLYVEMLKAGYTSVAEFHYLHHDPAGKPYAERAETSLRIASAARQAGIRLTLLPTLYAHGGFGGAPPGEAQRRFINTVDALLSIVERTRGTTADNPPLRVGLALHSLRAVTPEELNEAVAGFTALDPTGPIHIHIAEQVKEVEDCLAWSGRRPVEWLLDHVALSDRWCLVHATHLTPEETSRLARSGAVIGLCPTTEANLGDGIFPAEPYLRDGGRFGVGSDSHIGVSAAEELRLLEYGQRLGTRRRNVLRMPNTPSIGAGLYRAAVVGGSRALGLGEWEGIAVGAPADLLVLDPEHPRLAVRSGDLLLDSYVFGGDAACVRDVMVGGRFVVREGRHPDEAAIAARYRQEAERLAEES